jgi:hypothetical protein
MSEETHEGIQLLPEFMIDPIGPEDSRATWVFCGAFPLKEIASGCRACRYGWRNRGYTHYNGVELVHEDKDESWPMLSVISDGEERSKMFIEFEYADDTAGVCQPANSATDMLAQDWYLEKMDETK